MTVDLTVLLSVAIGAVVPCYIARVWLRIVHGDPPAERLEQAFRQHERDQAELMASWKQAIADLDTRIRRVSEDVKQETNGTLAAAAEGMQRRGWR